jgi:hypothetical protein
MERCEKHDLLNCKCKEPLAQYLVRQFTESPNDRVVRASVWAGDRAEHRVRDRGILGGEDTRR